jgi:hypothetical protein
MFVLATHANQNDTALPPTFEDINSVAELMYTIYARLPNYGPAPTEWRMRNGMGRHIGGGELGLFTRLFTDIVRSQMMHGPLMVSFNNNLAFEIYRREDME